MSKFIIPEYLIDPTEKVYFDDNGEIVCPQNGLTIVACLEKMHTIIPKTLDTFFEYGALKSTTFFACNGILLTPQEIKVYIVESDDEIEILSQFAGG